MRSPVAVRSARRPRASTWRLRRSTGRFWRWEEEIGAPLFERLPRGLRLTAAGELCIEHIRDVLKNYERLEGRIRSLKMQQAGKVRMVTTVGLAAGPLPEIIARFLSEHPRVFVQLRNDTGGQRRPAPLYQAKWILVSASTSRLRRASARSEISISRSVSCCRRGIT